MGNAPPTLGASGDSNASMDDASILVKYAPCPWNNKLKPLQGLSWGGAPVPLPDQTAKELLRVRRPQSEDYHDVREWNAADVTRAHCRELLNETWTKVGDIIGCPADENGEEEKEEKAKKAKRAEELYHKWAVVIDGLHDSVQEMARRAFDREDLAKELASVKRKYIDLLDLTEAREKAEEEAAVAKDAEEAGDQADDEADDSAEAESEPCAKRAKRDDSE